MYKKCVEEMGLAQFVCKIAGSDSKLGEKCPFPFSFLIIRVTERVVAFNSARLDRYMAQFSALSERRWSAVVLETGREDCSNCSKTQPCANQDPGPYRCAALVHDPRSTRHILRRSRHPRKLPINSLVSPRNGDMSPATFISLRPYVWKLQSPK